jgi:hypothetical protein
MRAGGPVGFSRDEAEHVSSSEDKEDNEEVEEKDRENVAAAAALERLLRFMTGGRLVVT